MGAARRPRISRLLLLALGVLAAVYLAIGLLRPQWLLTAALRAEHWRSGAERIELEIENQRWVYLQRGAEDGPVWLLVHGFTGSKENWTALMRQLPRELRLIAPDLPGWGESQPTPGLQHDWAAQARRLAGFMDALDLREVVLVGHSMGGGVAALTAAEHPQRIARLVLLSPAGIRFRDNDFGLAVLRGEHPFEVHDVADLDRYLGLVFKHPPPLPWPLPQALVEKRRDALAFERRVLAGIGTGGDAFAPGESAFRIARPSLVLGCREDAVIDASAVELYAERIPDAQSEMLKDCGHMPMMERPAQTAQALLSFAAGD
jgi:abhydrolase domain-containing protein 6